MKTQNKGLNFIIEVWSSYIAARNNVKRYPQIAIGSLPFTLAVGNPEDTDRGGNTCTQWYPFAARPISRILFQFWSNFAISRTRVRKAVSDLSEVLSANKLSCTVALVRVRTRLKSCYRQKSNRNIFTYRTWNNNFCNFLYWTSRFMQKCLQKLLQWSYTDVSAPPKAPLNEFLEGQKYCISLHGASIKYIVTLYILSISKLSKLK